MHCEIARFCPTVHLVFMLTIWATRHPPAVCHKVPYYTGCPYLQTACPSSFKAKCTAPSSCRLLYWRRGVTILGWGGVGGRKEFPYLLHVFAFKKGNLHIFCPWLHYSVRGTDFHNRNSEYPNNTIRCGSIISLPYNTKHHSKQEILLHFFHRKQWCK